MENVTQKNEKSISGAIKINEKGRCNEFSVKLRLPERQSYA